MTHVDFARPYIVPGSVPSCELSSLYIVPESVPCCELSSIVESSQLLRPARTNQDAVPESSKLPPGKEGASCASLAELQLMGSELFDPLVVSILESLYRSESPPTTSWLKRSTPSRSVTFTEFFKGITDSDFSGDWPTDPAALGIALRSVARKGLRKESVSVNPLHYQNSIARHTALWEGFSRGRRQCLCWSRMARANIQRVAR